MSLEMRKLPVERLALGMFVSKLDRSWIETPFPLQGFYIRSHEEILALRKYCREVYIDVRRSDRGVMDPLAANEAAAKRSKLPLYPTLVAMPEEVRSGEIVFDDLQRTVAELFTEMRHGRIDHLQAASGVASQMVDSVIRNPDAMVWLARMRDRDGYSYAHAIRSSLWAIVFGRHLGLSKIALDSLALSVLLMDVGKIRLPASLLQKPRLEAAERSLIEAHVQHSLDILGSLGFMNADMLKVVAQHHERFDGSGYPHALAGPAICPMAKIAGIVDTYDAMTSPRQHSLALTSVEVVSRLYELRNKAFQARLVDEFIQAIGVYPTGTLVRLSSGEVGIITEQNPLRRLRPNLLLLLDAEKNRLSKPRLLRLDQCTHDIAGEPLKIASSLLPGSYGLYAEQWQLDMAAA